MAISLQKRVNTITSYIVRPYTYPFLLRLIKTTLFGGSTSLDHTQDKATIWCRRRAINTTEAIHKITGCELLAPISCTFESIFKQAESRISQCPQKMGGAGNLDLIYSIAHYLKAVRVIETGVAYGWSSLAILLAISKQSSPCLISTNLHYSRYGDDSYVGCAVPNDLKQFWTILREADRIALPKALAMFPEYDLCHYDSDKTYGGRIWAYPLLWQSLRIGGCFVSDDIGDNLAFAHFCKMVRTNPIVVRMPSSTGEKYVGILVKRDRLPPRQIMF
ncbi:class I SAM-dependent methyltransferase [Oculatella sp. LEGE 06141]|uniref:class I SAM-dependent methyltransferase n=1 Tax=Oculatella sp. LEGE 06141 TaxID=1828648 RepID=UPI00187ED80C|nr:class I SAM-dependent methyltransferase [Oculatella sp. LEGE 06141]MBE9179513.1 class I SAM-dependent methyltransferase [Oculatella sp. LEGE 06141]